MKNDHIAHYGIPGMKWDIRKKKEELAEQQEALRKRKAEQAANRKSTKGMTKAQKEEYKAQRESEKNENKAAQEAIFAKRVEIANLTKSLMESKQKIQSSKRNFERQKQLTSMIMSRHGAKKIRIV